MAAVHNYESSNHIHHHSSSKSYNYSKPLFLSGKFQLFFHDFTTPYLFDPVSVFEYGNPSRRNELADQLMGQIVPLCLPLYGCEVIQKVLHIIKPDQRVRLASELDGQVLRCV
ncbi:unnamed protein product [Brassica oleracea]